MIRSLRFLIAPSVPLTVLIVFGVIGSYLCEGRAEGEQKEEFNKGSSVILSRKGEFAVGLSRKALNATGQVTLANADIAKVEEIAVFAEYIVIKAKGIIASENGRVDGTIVINRDSVIQMTIIETKPGN